LMFLNSEIYFPSLSATFTGIRYSSSTHW
jgi:hypothetical protein